MAAKGTRARHEFVSCIAQIIHTIEKQVLRDRICISSGGNRFFFRFSEGTPDSSFWTILTLFPIVDLFWSEIGCIVSFLSFFLKCKHVDFSYTITRRMNLSETNSRQPLNLFKKRKIPKLAFESCYFQQHCLKTIDLFLSLNWNAIQYIYHWKALLNPRYF